MSLHAFDPVIAGKVGLNAAVIYQNIVFWMEKNQANERHFIDGRYWTYNSTRAFGSLFPYLSENQIRTAITKLEDEDLLVSANHNDKQYDRTKWYSANIHMGNITNGIVTDHEPIPDSKPDVKPDGKLDMSSEDDDVQKAYDAFILLAEKKPAITKPRGDTPTTKRASAIRARMKEHGGLEGWMEMLRKVWASPFLTGLKTDSTPASLDWCSNKANFLKIIEGNYDDKSPSGQSGPQGGIVSAAASVLARRRSGLSGGEASSQSGDTGASDGAGGEADGALSEPLHKQEEVDLFR